MEYKSKMLQEIEEIPDAASNLLDKVDSQVNQLINVFIEQQPNFITTVARGSSDHAATFLKYLFTRDPACFIFCAGVCQLVGPGNLPKPRGKGII